MPVEGGLPPLPDFGVFLYVREDGSALALQLAGIIRDVDFNPSAIAKRGERAKQGKGLVCVFIQRGLLTAGGFLVKRPAVLVWLNW